MEKDRLPQRIVAGKYKLEQVIGMGAHAEVYRALSLKENRPVAVKLFYEHLKNEILQYILKELKIISSLSHPNILKVVAFGRGKCENRLVHYMVTPLMEGASLAELIKNEKPGLARSLKIVFQIAQALQYMHEHQVIHRDVKPQNILIDSDGNAILADFGIACAADRTQTSVAGTMEYCSPEQLDNISNPKADARMDIYSLGITLYEMLTGINPYRRIAEVQGQAAAIRYKYVQEYPSVLEYDSTLPRGLGLVVDRMVKNNPKERYSKMAEVLDELQPYVHGIEGEPHFLSKTEIRMAPQIQDLFEEALRLRNEKQWEAALKKYDEVISLMPGCAQAYNYKGELLLQRGLYPQALECLDLAIQHRPSYYSACCRRAFVYICMGEFHSAALDLDKMIVLFPGHPEAFFYKSLLHKNQAQRHQEEGKTELWKQEIGHMKECLRNYRSLKQKTVKEEENV